MTPKETLALRDDLDAEFQRWLDRLPCYTNERDYEGWLESVNRELKETMVNHVWMMRKREMNTKTG